MYEERINHENMTSLVEGPGDDPDKSAREIHFLQVVEIDPCASPKTVGCARLAFKLFPSESSSSTLPISSGKLSGRAEIDVNQFPNTKTDSCLNMKCFLPC